MIKFRVDTAGAKIKLSALGKGFNERAMLNAVGERILRFIDEQFATGGHGAWPKLRPNTVIGKGNSVPLVETGGLRRSFFKRVNARYSVTVGSRSPLASFHQEGTGQHRIEASGSSRLRFLTTSGVRFSRAVEHPGNPARPMLPNEAEAKLLAVEAVQGVVNGVVRRLPK